LPPPSPSPPLPPPPPKSPPLSDAEAIAVGIVSGIVGGLLALLGAAFFYFRYRRQRLLVLRAELADPLLSDDVEEELDEEDLELRQWGDPEEELAGDFDEDGGGRVREDTAPPPPQDDLDRDDTGVEDEQGEHEIM
jgi:hypothetical protein